MTQASATFKTIELKTKDLNPLGGVHCPSPSTPSWSSHPKVFIDVAKHGHGNCHYCGTVYQLAAGEQGIKRIYLRGTPRS